jgi:hypothetical protein
MTPARTPPVIAPDDEADEATVKMPRLPEADKDDKEFDPESTLVREDWESTVIRRIAPHVTAVQNQVAEEPGDENRFGWESESLRRLAHEVQKTVS